MHRLTILSAVAIFALGFARTSSAGDWEHQRFADGKFTITFPATPKKIIGKTPDGTDFPTFLCNRNAAGFGVSWMPIEKLPRERNDSHSLGTHMLNNLKSNPDFKNHKVLFLNPISYAGWAGADLGASVVSGNGKTLYFRQRFIATKTHLIQIVYSDTARTPLEPWVGDIFFNSLTTADEGRKAAAATAAK